MRLLLLLLLLLATIHNGCITAARFVVRDCRVELAQFVLNSALNRSRQQQRQQQQQQAAVLLSTS